MRVFHAGENEPYRRHVYQYEDAVATEYSYNSDSQWSGGIRYDTSNAKISSFFLRYNSAGDVSEYFDADRVTTLKIVYTYAAGFLERGDRYDGNDDAFGYLEFATDTEGNILERRRYSKLGTLLDYREISYDADGNRIRVDEYDANDELTKVITFRYELGTPLPNAWVVS